MHFCLRDIIFNHIHAIMMQGQNGQYVCRRITELLLAQTLLFGIVSIMMYITAEVFEMPQLWLKNIVEKCDKEVEINSEG